MADALKIEIDADTRSAIANLVALAKATDTATEAAGKLGKAQKELEEKQAKVKELFAKGFSDELPEKAKNASAAFKLFGDTTLTTGERSRALFAGLSIGKSVIAGYAGAVTGAVSSLVQMSEAARAAEVRLEQQREVLAALGPAMGAVSQSTGGAASATDAWTARNALLGAGLRVTSEQLATVVEGARRHREAGESSADSITRMVAVIAGEQSAQERVGIVTRTNADAHERLTEVTTRLAAEQARLGAASQTASERQAQQATNIQRAQDGALAVANEMFNPLHHLLQAGGALVDGWDRGARAIQSWRGASDAGARTATAFGAALDPVKQRIRDTANAENDAASAAQNLKSKNDVARASFDQLAAAATATRTAMRELQRAQANVSLDALAGETHEGALNRNVEAGARQYERQQRSQRLGREARDRLVRERGLSRSAANQIYGITEAAGEQREPKWLTVSLAQKAETEADRLAQIDRRLNAQAGSDTFTEEQRAALVERQLNAQAGADAYAEEIRRANESKANDNASALRTQQQADAERQRRENPGEQLRDAFLPAAMETQTAAEKMAEGVSGAFATMTGAVKSHMAALIEGRETAGEAMLGIAHDTLLALSTEAVGRSLMSLGGALAALAVGSPTAPLLFASAAAYAGVAALAGVGAAATGAAMSGAAPAASAGSRAPPAAASAGGSSRGGGEGTAITINVNGTVMDREGTADSIRELLNDSLSRGGTLRAA